MASIWASEDLHGGNRAIDSLLEVLAVLQREACELLLPWRKTRRFLLTGVRGASVVSRSWAKDLREKHDMRMVANR